MKEILITIILTGIVTTLYPYLLRILDLGMQYLENKATLSATKTQVKINELLPQEEDTNAIGFQYDYGDDEYIDYDDEEEIKAKQENRIGY